jgi:Na+/proline symporter
MEVILENMAKQTQSDENAHLFSWEDYAVFITLLVISSLIGVYFGYQDFKTSKKKKENITSDEGMLSYLVAGRKMKFYPVGCSLVATLVCL